jgi:hypothetical protein
VQQVMHEQNVQARPLDVKRRLLGSSAIVYQQPGATDISVKLDLQTFITRLLLFDTYVLYSIRLKEFPEMVRHFGFEGTKALLSSGALEIRCECAQFMEGQFSTRACPLFTFQFHVIEAHGRNKYVIDNLSNLNSTALLGAQQRMELQAAVMKAIEQPDNRAMFVSQVGPGFEADVLHNSQFLKSAVRFVLMKEKRIQADDFQLKFHKVADDRYEAETDLGAQLALPPEDVHQVIKLALLGVGGVNLRLGEMNAHTALSGFSDEDLPLYRAKLNSLADALGSHENESSFQRVATITGLPDFSAGTRIDIEKLLAIRQEPEALEFRSWLAGVGTLTDSEIGERLTSLRIKLGLAAQSATGKLLRLLVTTAVSFEPHVGLALGPLASTLDQFIWDKFCRRSGLAAFVHELYPSIFQRK